MRFTKGAILLHIPTLFSTIADAHQVALVPQRESVEASPSSLDWLQRNGSFCSDSALPGIQSKAQNASLGDNSTVKQPMHVVVLGGSFTAGVGAGCETNRKRPSNECAWPHHLQRVMQSRGIPVLVENFAIAGSSAPGALPIIVGRLVASNAANPVDVVLIDYSPNHAALLSGKKKSSTAGSGLSKTQEVLCGTEALVRTLRCLSPHRPRVVFVEEGSRHVWPHGTLAAKYGFLVWNSKEITESNAHLPEARHQLLALEIADAWEEIYNKPFSTRSQSSKQDQFKYCDNRQEPAVDKQPELEACPTEVAAEPGFVTRKYTNASVANGFIPRSHAPLSCCSKRILEGTFAHCALPLKFATGYELEQSLAHAVDPNGTWHLFEDKPGKPGIIADDRTTSFDAKGLPNLAHSTHPADSPALELISPTRFTTSKRQSDLVFNVPMTKSGLITITYLRSYENMGRALVWLDTDSPENARVVKCLDGTWPLNVSLTDTFTWLPNRFFEKSKHHGEGGPRTKDWYRNGNHTLHVRLLNRGDVDSSCPKIGDPMKSAVPTPPGAGNKFKILSLTSC